LGPSCEPLELEEKKKEKERPFSFFGDWFAEGGRGRGSFLMKILLFGEENRFPPRF